MIKLFIISLLFAGSLCACSSNTADASKKTPEKKPQVELVDTANKTVKADTARGPLKVINEHYKLSQDPESPALMTFDTTHISFDTLGDQETFVARYDFTNTGSGPLMIREAYGQCSCSEPVYPKHEIKPGEKGFVEVTFNSSNKSGRFFTQVIIFANTYPEELNVLSLGGFITNKK